MSYFIPRRNRYYSAVAPLSRIVRYLLSLATISLCMATWYYLLYKPTMQTKQRYETEIMHSKEKIKNSKQIHQTVAKAEQALKQVQTDYALYSGQTRGTALLMIMQDAQKVGLTITSCLHEPHQQKHDWYEIDTFVFQAEGNAITVQKYLMVLQKRAMMLCRQITLHNHHLDKYTVTCHLEVITAKIK